MGFSSFSNKELEKFNKYLANSLLTKQITQVEKDRYCEFLAIREAEFKSWMLPALVPYFKETPLELNILYMDDNNFRFIIVFRVPKKVKTLEACFNIQTDSIDFSLNKSNVTLLHFENDYQSLLDAVNRVTSDYRLCSEFNLGNRAATMSSLEKFLRQTTFVSFPHFNKSEKPTSIMETRLDLKSGASLTLQTIYNHKTKESDISLSYSRHKKRSFHIDIAVMLKTSLYETFENLAFKLYFKSLYDVSNTPRNIDFVKMVRF